MAIRAPDGAKNEKEREINIWSVEEKKKGD